LHKSVGLTYLQLWKPNNVVFTRGVANPDRDPRANCTLGDGSLQPFSHVAESLRSAAIGATSTAAANPGDQSAMKDLASAESNLNGALGRLLMVAEAYPDLKANENMLALQEELTSTENKVSFARQSYNDSVTAYNTATELFPGSMVAKNFGFSLAQLFEVKEEVQRDAPKVEF